MTGSPERYSNPLTERYASAEMSRIFSPAFKFGTWRRLWLALAEAEQELGLPVSSEAIEQIKQHLDDVDLKRAAELERQLRHDVMAHVHQLGEQAPAARGVIHLGATSAYVGDNTDLIQHREALQLVRSRLVGVVAALARFARAHSASPTSSRRNRPPWENARPSGSRIFCSTSRKSSSDWRRFGSAACAARREPRPPSWTSSRETGRRWRR